MKQKKKNGYIMWRRYPRIVDEIMQPHEGKDVDHFRSIYYKYREDIDGISVNRISTKYYTELKSRKNGKPQRVIGNGGPNAGVHDLNSGERLYPPTERRVTVQEALANTSKPKNAEPVTIDGRVFLFPKNSVTINGMRFEW